MPTNTYSIEFAALRRSVAVTSELGRSLPEYVVQPELPKLELGE